MREEDESMAAKRPARKSPVLRWIILAVLLVAVVWFGIQALRKAEASVSPGGPSPGGDRQGPPPATVIVAPVTLAPVQERRRITGTLRAVARAEVAAQESGLVLEVMADAGSPVKKGDLLVSLDDRRLKASLAEAESMLTSARALVEERKAEESRAELDLERKQSLFSQRAVSEREFLDAGREASVAAARRKAAEDQVKASESSLELLKVRLEDLQVRAPFTGRIVNRHVDPGEWVAPGEGVVTLVSSGTIEAWLSVPERHMGQISEGGEPIEIRADGNGLSSAAIAVRAVADIDPTTRLFPVIVEIDDLEGGLVPGLSVHAELPVGDVADSLSVPVDAVIESASGASVFRAAPNPDGGMPIAEQVSVVVRFRREGRVYLDSATLKPGDQVVVEGNERLFPGTPLLSTPAGPRPPEEVVTPEVKP